MVSCNINSLFVANALRTCIHRMRQSNFMHGQPAESKHGGFHKRNKRGQILNLMHNVHLRLRYLCQVNVHVWEVSNVWPWLAPVMRKWTACIDSNDRKCCSLKKDRCPQYIKVSFWKKASSLIPPIIAWYKSHKSHTGGFKSCKISLDLSSLDVQDLHIQNAVSQALVASTFY